MPTSLKLTTPFTLPPSARTVVALACLAVALVACGGGNDERAVLSDRLTPALDTDAVQAPASGLIGGQVFLDGPVTGATVQLRSPSGEVLASTVSNEAGAFLLNVPPQLTRDFVVVATGGSASGRPVEGSLLMVQDDFEQRDIAVRVNVLSTLAAHVLDAGLRQSASYSPAQATAAVRAYLGLPALFDLRSQDVRQFDTDSFLRAGEGLPLQAYLEQVAGQIVADPTLTQPYRAVLLGATPEEIALDAATNLAEYGLEYLGRFDNPITEKISSWGLTVVGWLKPGAPDYSERFDRIDHKLDEMAGDIRIIQNQVSNLALKLDANTDRINKALSALGDLAGMLSLRNDYVTLSGNIAQARATVDAYQTDYELYLGMAKTMDVTDLLDSLAANLIRDIPKAIMLLQGVQTGDSSGMTSAAKVWHQLRALAEPGYPLSVGSDFFDALNAQQDYVTGIQLEGLNLLLEAHNYLASRNATGPIEDIIAQSSARTRPIFEDWSKKIRATQKAVAYPRIDDGLVANLYDGRLHVRHAAAMHIDDSGCTRLDLTWTEKHGALERSFVSPTPDCDFRFTNATDGFNALQPHGYSDWAVGDLPVFRWQRGVDNRTVAQSHGYDFSAILRHGAEAESSYVIGVKDNAAYLRWNLRNIGAFGYITPPVTTLKQLTQLSGTNKTWHSVTFSRPITPDPLAQKCSIPDGWTVRCVFP